MNPRHADLRKTVILLVALASMVAANRYSHGGWGIGMVVESVKQGTGNAAETVKKGTGHATETMKEEAGRATRKAKKAKDQATKDGRKALDKAKKGGQQLGTTAKAEASKGVKSVKKNATAEKAKKTLERAAHNSSGSVRNPSSILNSPGQALSEIRSEGARAGSNISRESKHIGGDIARESQRAAGDTTRETKRFAGDVSRESKHLGGDIARESKHAAGDIARETKRFGGDVSREGKRLGGDIARESKNAAGDVVREAKELGGDIAREGKHAAGDVSREGKVAIGNIREWPSEIGKKKSDPFAIGTLLGGGRRERRPIIITNEERREILRDQGYNTEQQEIIEQIVFSDGGLQGKYANEFDDSFNSAFEQELEQWWAERGSRGAELTDAEIDRIADRAYARAESDFLSRYGLGNDGSVTGNTEIALRTKDQRGEVIGPATAGSSDDSTTDKTHHDFEPIEIGPKPPGPKQPFDPPPSSDSSTYSTPTTPGSDNRKLIKDRIKSDFKNRLRDKLTEQVDKVKEKYGDAARDALKGLGELRDKTLETIKEKGQEKVVEGLEKLLVAGSVSGAQTATSVVRDMLAEYQDKTSAPTLKRDKGSELVLPHDEWSPLNPAGWTSTRHAAFDKAANEGKTVYQDANGNWYQNNDPKFVPRGPFTVLYRPVPPQPDGGTVKEERGNATEKDKIQVSDGEIARKVGSEYLGDWFKETVKEKAKEKWGEKL